MQHTNCLKYASNTASLLALFALVTVGGCTHSERTAATDHHGRIALGATASTDNDDDTETDDDVEVALADVPDIVKQAAMAAVPGFVLEEAEREGEGDSAVYDLEGKANGQTYEIEVTAAGVVTEIEIGNDDDDDNDNDGDEDDEDGG